MHKAPQEMAFTLNLHQSFICKITLQQISTKKYIKTQMSWTNIEFAWDSCWSYLAFLLCVCVFQSALFFLFVMYFLFDSKPLSPNRPKQCFILLGCPLLPCASTAVLLTQRHCQLFKALFLSLLLSIRTWFCYGSLEGRHPLYIIFVNAMLIHNYTNTMGALCSLSETVKSPDVISWTVPHSPVIETRWEMWSLEAQVILLFVSQHLLKAEPHKFLVVLVQSFL